MKTYKDLTESSAKVAIRNCISSLEKANKQIKSIKSDESYINDQKNVAEKLVNKAINELKDSMK